MNNEEGIVEYVQRLGVRSADGREGWTELLWRPRTHETQFDSQLRRGWIPQDGDPGEPWDRFLEQLQPLGTEVSHHERESGDVAAGTRQVRDQARSDWIGDDGQNDGNGGRGALDRLGCKRSLHDDYIDFALD